jgi:DNA-binding GntR family transcriptional regulator
MTLFARGPTDTDESFQNTSRGEFVYRALRDAIQDGQLKQGTRIREDVVARSLGVSRTPVREALLRLQTRGLLELAPGRGLVVVEISKPQLMELYAMREVLEGGAARFAAQHASESEIATLRHLLEEFRQAGDDPAKLAKINRSFHVAIYQAAHNRYLVTALNDLGDAMALLRDTTFSVQGRPKIALKEHRAIVTAIEQRQPDAAEAAARQHIQAAQRARISLAFSQDR